ncbi:hypothetical protein PTV76_003215 [Acinetobacter baumannii]|uniref:hypothetical protein n=1 Tax=Acinetobacter baumannii TaxID=470 RepID=UPI0004F6D039|nr:hypothetical protein [Acinetobacter baumannii]AIL78549.1 hypothetical protein IX87_07875 [Acinetobacter baumannii]EKW7786378.1 hypothetical protein [Acinetobacter baumannii]KQD88128.1 hypothetical protein APD31_19410 [Acinetobacter baumannii]KQD91923.1 hypothetical protein APD31_10255 [Acinetobacter baumannii]KQD96108.1 hypothetical protein APD31_02990 [Acinetobacter baumannii]
MNAPVNTQVNELQVLEQNVIVAAFGKENGIQELFNRMAEQARSIVPDVSTKKGRDAIASQAYKVSKSKTAVDNHGKDLVAGIKAQAAVIDRDRKAWRDQCDALRDEIRKPLDEWEKAEEDRIQSIKDRISNFDAGRVDTFSTSDLIQTIISEVEATAIDESFAEFANEAAIKKDAALSSYKKSLEIALKREAEQVELERLRKSEQERLQREHEERIAHEAAERARLEAERKAKEEAERVEREKQEAVAKAEREKREAAEREARLVAEKEAAELRAQHAAEAERKRIEAEQAAKLEAERKAEEARQANQAHRKKICNEALKGLLALGIDEAKGKEILQAINKGLVPHVSIKF